MRLSYFYFGAKSVLPYSVTMVWAASRNRCTLCSARSLAALVERSTARCFQAGSSLGVLRFAERVAARDDPGPHGLERRPDRLDPVLRLIDLRGQGHPPS
jgi:hypothetical protein